MINIRELDGGDLVSWKHPVTGKIYNFKVEYVDSSDDEQPVKLELIDDISEVEYLAVTPYIGFERRGFTRWPYASREALAGVHDIIGSDVVYVTLEDLFYSESATGEAGEVGEAGNFNSKGKVKSIEDIEQGDILRDPSTGALFEVIKVDLGMALLEIKTQSAQICASPHEEMEEWFTAPGDTYWVFLDYEHACDWFQTDTQIRAWALYLKDLLVEGPTFNDPPKIESISLTGDKLDLRLSSGEELSTTIPKLMLPKPEDLRNIRERGVNEILDLIITQIVEQNTKGKNCLICSDLNYAEWLTIKSKLEDSGYQVDSDNQKISW